MSKTFHELFVNNEEYTLYNDYAIANDDLGKDEKKVKNKLLYRDIYSDLSKIYPVLSELLMDVDNLPKPVRLPLKKAMVRTYLMRYIDISSYIVDPRKSEMETKEIIREVKKNDGEFKKLKESSGIEQENDLGEWKKAFVNYYVSMYVATMLAVQDQIHLKFELLADHNNNEQNSKLFNISLQSEIKRMNEVNHEIMNKIYNEVYPNLRILLLEDEELRKEIYNTLKKYMENGFINNSVLDELINYGIVNREFLINNNVNINKIALTRTSQELVKLIEYGVIEQDDIDMYIDEKEVVDENRNKKLPERIRMYKLISDTNLLILYLNGEVSSEEIKNRKFDIVNMLADHRLDTTRLISLKQRLLQDRNKSKANLILNEFPTKKDIVQLVKDEKITISEMMDLDQIGLCDDNCILDVFEQNKEFDEYDKMKLKAFFDFEKINQAIQNEDWRLVNFFKNKLADKEEILSIESLIAKDKSVSEMIDLNKQGLISITILEKKLENKNLLDEFEDGNINKEELLYLYNLSIIPTEDFALIISDEQDQNTLLKAYDEDKLSLNKLKDVNIKLAEMNDQMNGELAEDLCDSGILNKEGILFDLYIANVLNIKQIQKYYQKGKIQDEEIQGRCLQGTVDNVQLQELYYNGLIGSITIDKIVEQGIITKKEGAKIIKTASVEHVISDILNAEIMDVKDYIDPIFSNGNSNYTETRKHEDQGEEEKTKNKQSRHIVIDPRIRDEFIKQLGFTSKIMQKEKTFLNGYELYYNPENDMVIAEALIKEKNGEKKYAYGDATYIFHISQITRMINSTKTDIIEELKEKDIEIRRVRHAYTRWAHNVSDAVDELEGKRKSKYDEQEIIELVSSIRTPEQQAELNQLKSEISEGIYNVDDGRCI